MRSELVEALAKELNVTPKNRRLPLAAVNRILAETVLNIHRLHRLDLRNLWMEFS